MLHVTCVSTAISCANAVAAVVLSKLIADIKKQTVGGTWPHAAGWFEKIQDAHVQTLSALCTHLTMATAPIKEKTHGNDVDCLISQESC